MKKRKYIFYKDAKGKRHRCRLIEGDEIPREEFLRDFNQSRLNNLRFEMEEIRTDDQLDEMQKASRRSAVMWKIEQLRREMDR